MAEMEQRGIPHEYVVIPDEGHGFAENWVSLAALLENFLAEHVSSRKQG